MEIKKTFLVVGIVVLGFVVLLVLNLYPQKEGVVSVPNESERKDEPSDTEKETLNNIFNKLSDELTASTTEGLIENTDEKIGPNISITPYSVFIGFASKFGTSSMLLMPKEGDEVVVGYEWEALQGSQLFASVVLPEWDTRKGGLDKKYKVEAWDEESEKYIVVGEYASLEEIDFPREGLVGPSRFRVMGISPELLICPGERSFRWDLRFTFEGRLGLVRTPITQKLPISETCRMR